MCAIVNFILDNVSIENCIEASNYHYFSQFLQHVLNCLINYCLILSNADFEASIKLCSKLVNKIKPAIAQSLANRLNSDNENKDLKSHQKLESVIKEESDENEVEKPDDEAIQKCLIDTLHAFFNIFVQKRLVQSEANLIDCFSSLRVSSINSEREVSFESQILIDINQDMVDVYTILCQLMVEMSAIPSLSEKKTDKILISSSDEPRLWVQHLLVLGIYPKDSLQVCYSSISSMLDLITITKALLFDLPVPQLSIRTNLLF
jgi:hypothetical protein